MAHHHEHGLTFLKTPLGYLTKTGLTDNINSDDIIILRSNTYGIWTPHKKIVEYFINKSETYDKTIIKEILENENKCEILVYWCGSNSCGGCYKREELCEFWHGDRRKLNYSKIY